MSLALGEIQCFVSDLKIAKSFYQNVLGFNLVGESDKWLVFDISGIPFIVMSGAHQGLPKRTYGTECATMLCLKSDDIERDYALLKAKGVSFFSEINHVEQGRYVAFQDPEGNLLELIQK